MLKRLRGRTPENSGSFFSECTEPVQSFAWVLAAVTILCGGGLSGGTMVQFFGGMCCTGSMVTGYNL